MKHKRPSTASKVNVHDSFRQRSSNMRAYQLPQTAGSVLLLRIDMSGIGANAEIDRRAALITLDAID